MRVIRTALAAAAAASVLLTGNPATAAGIVIVEGESATSYTAGCGDGGDAWGMGPVTYNGRQQMFFPASGCTAYYTDTGAVAIAAASVTLSGVAPTVCGTVTVTGTTIGVATVCDANDTQLTLNFNPPVVSADGSYTVRWTTQAPTPRYANLFLDFMVGVGV